MKNNAKLLQGNVGWVITKMTFFMTFGMLGMILFTLVDTYFISKLGETQLAAIGFIFPVIYIFGSIAIGISNGASILISKAIGANDQNQVKNLATNAIVLAVLIVMVFVAVGWVTIRPMFSMLGASGQTLEYIVQYMQIWYAGMIFVVVPMVGNGAIRATGDMRTPTIIMLTAVVVNGFMDYFLIFGHGPFPKMGMQGAALATVIGRSTTFVLALLVLYFREKMISITALKFRQIWAAWKKIMYIGLPIAGTHLIMPLSMAIITKIIAGYGDPAVAGFGVASRVQAFMLSVLMALSSSIGPFIGQNLGAQKIQRIRKGINFSYRFSFIWGTFSLAVLWGFSEPIARIFSESDPIIEVIKLCFFILPFGFALQGIVMISFTFLNVVNKPIQAAILNAVFVFGLYIPLAIVLSHVINLRGVFWASPIALFIVTVVVVIWLRKLLMEQEEKFGKTEAIEEPAKA